MYRDKYVEVSRDGDVITRVLDSGTVATIVDLGDVVYISDGERTGYGRHILRKDNVWRDSSGKLYIFAEGMLVCSSGRVWHNVPDADTADMIVKSDT